MDTETHTLLDVGGEAPRLRRTLAFLLPGAPARQERGVLLTHERVTSIVTRPGLSLRPPAGTWEKKNVPPPLLHPDGRSQTHSSYFLSGSYNLQWPVKGNLVSDRGGGGVAFKTMLALYVEVEPVHRERGWLSSL